MKSIDLNKDYLHNLLQINGVFANIYYDTNGKVYKIFNKELSSTLIKELEYLNNLNIKSITNPIEFINMNGKKIGFSMKYFNGNTFNFYNEKYLKKIELIKIAKEKIVNIHKYPIIIGDLHDANILFNENDVVFCDPDGFLFHPLESKRKNILENEYFEHFKFVDQRCDIYLFNILTLSILLKRNWGAIRNSNITFGSDELNKIMSFINTFKENLYSESYIIDYLPENEKEFKKLTKTF